LTVTADVLVVGLGAMGAATLYQLARRGVKVIGFDQFAPPHTQGSTHGETRITREGVGEGLQFVPLVRRSHELWRELEAASGDSLLTACGGLIMARAGMTGHMHGVSDFVAASTAAATRFGIAHENLDARAIAARFPQFELQGDEHAYYEPGAGFLNPEACVSAQLRLATDLGAQLKTGGAVTLRQDGQQTGVECGGTLYRAATTVIAAGPWLPQLVPELAPRLSVCRQVLYWFALDGSVSYAPGEFPVFIWNWGEREEEVFYGFPQVDNRRGAAREIKIAAEQSLVTTTPETTERHVSQAEIETMVRLHVTGKLRGVTGLCRRAATCLYTRTADANFLIDRLPGRRDTIVVSACSGHGFKHSAAIGEAVADMAVSGRTPVTLLPFAMGANGG
jgi:sarcosine oxidase